MNAPDPSRALVTAQRVREVLAYSKETGMLTWSIRTSIRITVGREAGTINRHGYRVVEIDGRPYRAHRLAWLWMTGAWPVGDIDHINGSKDDNRWANLRDVSRSVNMQNQHHPPRNNTSGFAGVTRDKRRGLWVAQITLDYRNIYLGSFPTRQQAYAARAEGKARLHKASTPPKAMEIT